MEDRLTLDEFDALLQVSRAKKHARISACIARNAKRLSGLKYLMYDKNGQLALTEKGQQTLFLKRCVDALRAVAGDPAANPAAKLDADVATFLIKKGHIAPGASPDKFEITPRGRESLADIDSVGR